MGLAVARDLCRIAVERHVFIAGTGTGRGRAVEENGNTVIYGNNTDSDAEYELRIVIADGAIAASAYTGDFVL